MSGKEIMTLQFGHYSNFIGTHWWNIQDFSFDYDSHKPTEINHDVLYREGLTSKVSVLFTITYPMMNHLFTVSYITYYRMKLLSLRGCY